jgi:hypothetical protein
MAEPLENYTQKITSPHIAAAFIAYRLEWATPEVVTELRKLLKGWQTLRGVDTWQSGDLQGYYCYPVLIPCWA